METEEEYQKVQSFLAQLEALHARLDEREVLLAYSEAAKQIVLQFDLCMVVLETRKQSLLLEVQNKLAEQKNLIQSQQKEMKSSIEGCKRILEGGSLFYESNYDTALAIWKNVATLTEPKLQEGLIRADFSSTLMEVIRSHGTLSVDLQNITSNTPGHVSTLVSQNKGELCSQPSSIHFNPQDDTLFVCDSSSNSIKRISLKGTIITCKEGGNFRELGGIAFNHKTNIGYVIDKYSNTIKKFNTSWIGIRTEVYAGNGRRGCKDGVATHAMFDSPSDIAINQQTGDVYVSDLGNHKIRKISPQGVVTTIAGSGSPGTKDGLGGIAQFKDPTGIAFCEKSQILYVCDDNRIRVLSLSNHWVSTIPHTVNSARGVLVLPDGTLLVSLFSEHKLVKIIPQGRGKYELVDIVGSTQGKEDGTPQKCKLNGPTGMTYDPRTNMCFIADFGNQCIRKFSLL